MASTSKTRPTNKRTSTDPEGHHEAASPTPEPLLSAPVEPLQAAARTVTLETRTVFVTIMYLPSGQSPPSTPCRTRRLPQARTSTESGTARNLQPRRLGHPSSFWNLFGEAEAIRPGPLPRTSCPGDQLGTLSTSLPSLSSLPSPGSPSGPREPQSLERSEEAQGLLAGIKERSPGLRGH